MSTTWTTPETNLIKAEDLVRAREVLYTYRFNDDLRKLFEAMGVTRKIAKQQGTYLKAYKVTGTLENGDVAEGEIIPLSKYVTEPVAFEEIKLNKWRKATSAEAIMERGYDQAHDETLAQLLKDAQNGIKKQFFDFIKTGTGTAQGATFQAAIAQAWGKLQILFEDTDVQSVYFMHPLDIADFLGSSNAIVPQTVFGMKYIQDFIGMGSIIMNSNVPQGKVIATAKENIVCYYIPVAGNIFGPQLTFTTDQTGYIGVHTGGVYTNLTDEDVVVSGIRLFAERQDGIIISTIGEEASSDDGGDDTGA